VGDVPEQFSVGGECTGYARCGKDDELAVPFGSLYKKILEVATVWPLPSYSRAPAAPATALFRMHHGDWRSGTDRVPVGGTGRRSAFPIGQPPRRRREGIAGAGLSRGGDRADQSRSRLSMYGNVSGHARRVLSAVGEPSPCRCRRQIQPVRPARAPPGQRRHGAQRGGGFAEEMDFCGRLLGRLPTAAFQIPPMAMSRIAGRSARTCRRSVSPVPIKTMAGEFIRTEFRRGRHVEGFEPPRHDEPWNEEQHRPGGARRFLVAEALAIHHRGYRPSSHSIRRSIAAAPPCRWSISLLCAAVVPRSLPRQGRGRRFDDGAPRRNGSPLSLMISSAGSLFVGWRELIRTAHASGSDPAPAAPRTRFLRTTGLVPHRST